MRHPAWILGLVGAVCLASACGRDPQALAARSLQTGDAYTRQGKLAEAIIEYRNAVQAQPHDGPARLKLAEAYWTSKDRLGATREYVRAADLMPERVDVQLKAGNLCLQGGYFDDARVRAEKALVAGDNPDAHILLAAALAGLKHLDAAVEHTQRAIELAPTRGTTYASLGALEMTRGRLEAAEHAFKKAVLLDGNSAATHLALANFYWSHERKAEAKEEVERALTIEPASVAGQRVMAGIEVGLNHPEEAEAHLKQVLALSNTPAAALALADFYLFRKNEIAARQVLESLRGTPAASQADLRLATLDHAAGREESAFRRLEQILATNPSDLDALVAKSRWLLTDGRRDDALAAAQLAVQSHQNSSEAWVALGTAHAAQHHTDAAVAAYKDAIRANPNSSAAQLALARLSLGAGRAAEAVTSAEQALRSNPANLDGRLVLVRGLIASGDLARARTVLTGLSTDFPKSAAVRVESAKLLTGSRDLAGARKQYELALELAPDSVEALSGLVALDLATKQPGAARARVEARAAREDADVGMLLLAAHTYIATGDGRTGEQLLQRIVRKDTTYLPAYSALARLYLRERRLDAALSQFSEMADRDPKPVAALTMTGIIFEAQGKKDEARKRYERALQIDSRAAVAANNLAWIDAAAGTDLDRALQLARDAYTSLPESAEVRDTLGFIYYKKNLLPQAVEALTDAVAKNPSDPQFQYHLGLALTKRGDKVQAKQHLARALSLSADFQGAPDARALLQTLQ